jgi:hypothetical protein
VESIKHQEIFNAVSDSVEKVRIEFNSHPTQFFTESDIVSYFYSFLLQRLPDSRIYDKDNNEHLLVHREYPTPFRCDMERYKFGIKDENALNKNGRKFQRGHYDLVVLNPNFIKRHSYKVIKAQNYKLFKEEVLSRIDHDDSIILYGLEFVYRREPLKYSRGDDKEKGMNKFVARILQDAEKLVESKKYQGFMDRIRMLVFIKGSPRNIRSLLKKKLHERAEITLCFGD